MKKLIITILSSLLLLPNIIMADMGAPEIGEYEAQISNPDGVKVYDYELKRDITLEYGTTGTVSYEFESSNKEITVSFTPKNGKGSHSYDINSKNIVSISEKFDLNNERVEKEQNEIIVSSKDGLQMKTGPASTGFKNIGKVIPSLSIVKSTHYLGYSPWYYVEYDGVKGWINIIGNNGAVYTNYYYPEIITLPEAAIYDINGKKLKDIKENTIIKQEKLYLTSDWDRDIYIDYEGTIGFISEYSVIKKSKKPYTIILKTDLELLEYTEDKAGTIIPKGTSLESQFVYDEYENYKLYTEYKGEKGWLLFNNENYYVGCDYTNNVFYVYDIKDKPENPVPEYTTTKPTTTKPTETTTVHEENPNPKNTVYYCIAAAVVLVVTALLTIVVINKKKDSNN